MKHRWRTGQRAIYFSFSVLNPCLISGQDMLRERLSEFQVSYFVLRIRLCLLGGKRLPVVRQKPLPTKIAS